MSDLSDEAIRAYAANIFGLEDAREAAQDDLKKAWAHIREDQGKKFADSFKLAIKRARMDTDKRNAADEIDAEAERIMSVLSSRAPRATRAHVENIEEFDADGVVIERSGGALDARLPPKQEVAGSNPAQIAISRTDQDEPAPTSGLTATTSSAGTEGEADRQPIIEPAPLSEGVAAVGGGSANHPVASAAIPIADQSKPNPICRDPDDCGVYASWAMPCQVCKAAAAHRSAA